MKVLNNDKVNIGIGTEVTKLVLNFAFNTMGYHKVYHKVYLRVLEYNKRAINCYEKCGFNREGIDREALMGMEELLGIKYKPVKSNGRNVSYANKSKYTLVFYADDFVIMCNTQKDAEDVYGLLKPYLEKRGLELSKEKQE
ncbi:GNAT family N-acetyltransferase [Desulfosporosinus sp. OT]|uniref:GNAT family N-acetyltransferase n=1 Tax=Desulfosporosinus sp. OT TaxID=913865 RepID=UPI001FA7FBD5|nr:GNAT family N-acetyltransferase [Desulfosporosinus sp. OT]